MMRANHCLLLGAALALAVAGNGEGTAAARNPPQPGQPFTIASLELEMLWIAPGAFRMGSDPGEPGHEPDERAVDVRLTDGFWLGRTEVTVGQWTRFVEDTRFTSRDADRGIHIRMTDGWKQTPDRNWRDPGFLQTDRHPVVGVSWEDAMAFCQWLTKRERDAGRLPDGWAYELPTEARWEFACRAGSRSAFAWGETLDNTQACFGARSPGGNQAAGTTPVAHFTPNTWGLFDMHGNVWEWCADAYGDYPEAEGALVDPVPAQGDRWKVKRGGSWIGAGENCRSANRNRDAPDHRAFHIGFRLCLPRAGK